MMADALGEAEFLRRQMLAIGAVCFDGTVAHLNKIENKMVEEFLIEQKTEKAEFRRLQAFERSIGA